MIQIFYTERQEDDQITMVTRNHHTEGVSRGIHQTGVVVAMVTRNRHKEGVATAKQSSDGRGRGDGNS
jgi:hypothetical protein